MPFRADKLVATFLELFQDANGGTFDEDEEEYNSLDSGVDDGEVINNMQEMAITDDIKSDMKIDSEKADSGIGEECITDENQTQSDDMNSKHSRDLSLGNSFAITSESPAHKRSKVGTGTGDLSVNGRESPVTGK